MMFELVVKWGFTITLPLLLLLYFIKREWRPFTKNWLWSSCTLVFIYFGVELAGKIGVLIGKQIAPTSSNEVHNFYHGFGYGATLYLYFAFKFLLIVLFAFKRIRKSVAWGIGALLLLHKEELTLAIWYEFRNYYPSSWAIYYHLPFDVNLYLFCPIVFNLLVFAIYFSKQFLVKNTSKAPSL